MQSEGLVERCLNDEEFRINVKMISAIAFVPTDDVIDAFTELSDHCGQDEQAILDYFETYYIGEQRCGRRLHPRFAHEMWNVHGRVKTIFREPITIWRVGTTGSMPSSPHAMATYGNSFRPSKAIPHFKTTQGHKF